MCICVCVNDVEKGISVCIHIGTTSKKRFYRTVVYGSDFQHALTVSMLDRSAANPWWPTLSQRPEYRSLIEHFKRVSFQWSLSFRML